MKAKVGHLTCSIQTEDGVHGHGACIGSFQNTKYVSEKRIYFLKILRIKLGTISLKSDFHQVRNHSFICHYAILQS